MAGPFRNFTFFCIIFILFEKNLKRILVVLKSTICLYACSMDLLC
jgi:hypothetical protein